MAHGAHGGNPYQANPSGHNAPMVIQPGNHNAPSQPQRYSPPPTTYTPPTALPTALPGAQPAPDVERNSDRKQNLQGYWQRQQSKDRRQPASESGIATPAFGGRTRPGHVDTQGQKNYMQNPYYSPAPADRVQKRVPGPAFGGRQPHKAPK